ncbi:MAG: hypothetical protein Q9196_004956 [Gyalolechia fulgens]
MAPKDIESLLPQLLSFPPHPPPPLPLSDTVYDKEIRILRKALNDTPANALTGGVPNGGDLLDILDPSINTLPYLYVLFAHINASRQKASIVGGPLWFKALDFFERFDPVQVRYVGTEFRRLVVHVRDAALASNQHDTSAGYITDQSELSAAITYRDPLQYFIYGAMIYMALKEWHRAIPFLEAVLTAPSRNHASRIQVEAYKKWVLVNLLAHGHVPGSLPKTTTSQVAKEVRTLGKAYEALGVIFRDVLSKEVDARRLDAEVHAGNQKWSEDHNMSLVLHVLDAYRQFTIIKLGLTYAALPLPIVTQRTSSNPDDHTETAQYISMMINSSRLNATLDQRTQDPQSWVLRFALSPSTGPRARSEQESYEELVKQTARNAKLAEHVRETDRKLTLSKDYINWLKQSKKDTLSTATEVEEASTLPGQHPFDDEDIMGDG